MMKMINTPFHKKACSRINPTLFSITTTISVISIEYVT